MLAALVAEHDGQLSRRLSVEHPEVTFTTWRLLAEIDAGDTSGIAVLAERATSSRRPTSGTVSLLVARGWVERLRARRGGFPAYRLTAEGRRVLRAVEETRVRVLGEALAHLDLSQQTALAQLLGGPSPTPRPGPRVRPASDPAAQLPERGLHRRPRQGSRDHPHTTSWSHESPTWTSP